MVKQWQHTVAKGIFEATSALNLHPEYLPCPENAEAIINYVLENDLPVEPEGFEQAFEELERRGEILPRHLQRRES